MRRLLVPLLLLPLALGAPAASAGCDEETGECHAVDCLPWQPADHVGEAAQRAAQGDPSAAEVLLPPACPA